MLLILHIFIKSSNYYNKLLTLPMPNNSEISFCLIPEAYNLFVFSISFILLFIFSHSLPGVLARKRRDELAIKEGESSDDGDSPSLVFGNIYLLIYNKSCQMYCNPHSTGKYLYIFIFIYLKILIFIYSCGFTVFKPSNANLIIDKIINYHPNYSSNKINQYIADL
jgi:hypothetical protein